MNHLELYENLMRLPDPFRWRDFEWCGRTFRSFGYAYIGDDSMWTPPGALDSRGTTFDVTDEVPRLASLPMGKFFNLHEPACPIAYNERPDMVMRKLDGTLLMTVTHPGAGEWSLKTKMSFDHPAIADAEMWLLNNLMAFNEVGAMVRGGYTVCFEWTAPDNRIVVGYDKPCLNLLGARSHLDGEYIPVSSLGLMGPTALPKAPVLSVEDAYQVQESEGTEGVVIVMRDGRMAKIKSPWYLRRHRWAEAKPKALIAAVLDGEADDLRAMFHDAPDILRRLEEVVEFIAGEAARRRALVKAFTHQYPPETTSRKDYAIAAKGQVSPTLFPFIMDAYAGDVDMARHFRRPTVRRRMFDDFADWRGPLEPTDGTE